MQLSEDLRVKSQKYDDLVSEIEKSKNSLESICNLKINFNFKVQLNLEMK